MQILKDNQPSWAAGAGLTYNYDDQQYPTTFARMEYEDYIINAQVKKWFNMNNSNLSLGFNTALKFVGDNLLRHQEKPSFTNFVSRNILNPNFAYQNTNYWANQLEVQYTLPAFKKTNAQLYFKTNYQNISSTETMLDSAKGLSNNYFNFTIGLIN